MFITTFTSPATCPYPEPDRTKKISPSPRPCKSFVNRKIVRFYGDKLLALLPVPKMEYHHRSAVGHYLFSIFAALLHIWRPFLHPQCEDLPFCCDRTHLSPYYQNTLISKNALNSACGQNFYCYIRKLAAESRP